MNSTRVAPIPEFSVGTGLGNVQRLRDLAKQRGVDVARATERFTLEASLRRIFASDHADKFGYMTLKGGSLMYFSEKVEPLDSRPTRDIDIELAGYNGTLEELKETLSVVLAKIPEIDDGVRFHVDGMTSNEVSENRALPGGSISCPVQIGSSMYEFKVDAGFHPLDHREDVIRRDYVSMIPKKLPAFQVPCRPIEYALADKIQACVRHGLSNSRLRDYYDMTVFTTNNPIDDTLAIKAISKIFPLYGSVVPQSTDEIEALSDEFVSKNSARWEKMRDDASWPVAMPPLQEVVANLRTCIQSLLDGYHAAYPSP